MDLRRINHHGHPQLTMACSGAIEPDGIGIIDGDCEHLASDAASRVQEAAVNCARARRDTGFAIIRLRDGMVSRIEVEMDLRADGRHDYLGLEDEATITDIYVDHTLREGERREHCGDECVRQHRESQQREKNVIDVKKLFTGPRFS